MITTKIDFNTIVEMYKKLHEFGHDIDCMSLSDGICKCELDKIMTKARKIIEQSAEYLNLIRKRYPCGKFQKRKRQRSSNSGIGGSEIDHP